MNSKGQILVGVVIMMLVMSIIIPIMVMYTQNEARWGLKQGRSMTAFQVAEAGIDRGYRKISESTTTWNNCQAANCPTYYLGDSTYTDVAGGRYKVYIASGPKSQQVTIISVAQDTSLKETRAIAAVYANTPLGNTAVRGNSTVGMSPSGGSAKLITEWGAVISGAAMDLTSLSNTLSPQFWSPSSITPFKTVNSGALCDSPGCWQWHAYQSGIPPFPPLDLGFYASTAQAETGCPAGGSSCVPAGNTTCCYYNGDQTWGGGSSGSNPCNNTTSCGSGNVVYVNGNLNVAAGGIYVMGSLVVTGNVTFPNGVGGTGFPWIDVPLTAWQQYGNNWSYYSTKTDNNGNLWDATAPAAFPGIDSSYQANNGNAAYVVQPTDCASGGSGAGKVATNGFFYVGGNLTAAGGAGKGCFYGAVAIMGTATLSPNNFEIYYTDYGGQQLKSTEVILTRISWQDLPTRGF